MPMSTADGPPRAAEAFAQSLVVDAQGFVVAGAYFNEAGDDVGEAIAAHLAGIGDEAARAVKFLDLGEWRSIVFETETMAVGVSPGEAGATVVVAAPRAMPLGMLRRTLARRTSAAIRAVTGGTQ
jgi:predicted regulator of Ras-like GTPase activity (Roadblock/LC7/MglB family)